jgi:hypothetical protein
VDDVVERVEAEQDVASDHPAFYDDHPSSGSLLQVRIGQVGESFIAQRP